MVPLLLQVFLGLAAILVAGLSLAFWRDPEAGMRLATHRKDQLPRVMADRYLAVAVIAVGLIVWGSVEMVAVFFAASAIMGLGDGWIYARAGLPHGKHTATGVLALIALAITLAHL